MMVLIALYLAAVFQVFNIIFKWRFVKNRLFVILDFSVLAVTMVFVRIFQDSPSLAIPPLIGIFISLLSAFYSIWGIADTHTKSKNTLSADSIRDAINNLPAGICFTDPKGRVVLCNHAMSELTAAFQGETVRSKALLDEMIEYANKNEGLKISGGIWEFEQYPLPGSELKGYTQIMAYNVTELYEGINLLNEENKELKIVNKALSRMYNRLADKVREKETLDLKMKIHNNIGTSLLMINEILDEDSAEQPTSIRKDISKQLEILQDAVSYLVDDSQAEITSLDDLCAKAFTMGAALVINGELPSDSLMEKLIVSAAGECITNCIKHAKGDCITVSVANTELSYHVEITNNGVPPKGEIFEGGGLSSLRRKISAAGGFMSIKHDPVFTMILELPKKGDLND